MTALADILLRRIATSGPMTLGDYMSECLLHPEHGYYTRSEPFGTAGDFITAPEVSQMFGEMLGLALAQAWMDQGQPARFVLAEPGPGRGTLMADILRATRAVPGFHAALSVHLIEASSRLRDFQRDKLKDAQVTWHDHLSELPDNQPLYLVANEFFDALPIRQFQRADQGWHEVVVAAPNGALTLALSAAAPIAALDSRLSDSEPGDIVETCPSAAPAIAGIASQIATHGGAALILDYGGWRSKGDTFQALRNHEPLDPLSHCGEADLTAHVDFEALAQAATPVLSADYTEQGAFLERLGITHRAQTLAQRLSGDALEQHIAAHRRLTHPQEMGTLFKVLGLRPHDAPQLPGFAA
ncbi:ATP synthase subunit beta [Actibacterium mucosum KCTC 23349]|uniref:ATP synthase subunit beta n=1 Tax=Actibacterium mucosum KCTC 23349 TaxID=1454373 RepID=A0A037ZHQ9_9RHOB|nr:SAM-dependent methyltransferase [Actibacterium mucosum]KAJ55164.1 ATP synthase subunit beta [Actibacterium mucosum KCTC 23349]